ncbi:MAG: hypothetical protein ACOVLC_04215 [Flavobacterium sp.]
MKHLIFGLIATVFILNIGFAQVIPTNIGLEGAKKIAVEHNNYLSALIKNNPTTKQNVYDFFMSYKFDNLKDGEQKLYFDRYSYDSNLNFVKKYISNEIVFQLIENSNKIVENESLTLSQIVVELDNQQKIAFSKLKSIDLDVVLVYTEVLKKSAEFWIEKSKGGNGVGNNFLNQRRIPRSHKILAADAMGASGSLIVGAFVAGCSGPIAPLSFFAAVAGGAAWSSGCAVIGL